VWTLSDEPKTGSLIGDDDRLGARASERWGGDKERVATGTGASALGKLGVQMIRLGLGSQACSTWNLTGFFGLAGIVVFVTGSDVMSLRASSRPRRLPRSLMELLSGGGITD
jgi:hypothetical protein